MNQPSERTEPGIAGQRTPPGAQALNSARAHVEQMLAAFLADPRGEAGQMARTLLLNSLVRDQTRQEEQTLRELEEQKRHRGVLAEDVETLAVSRLNAHTRNQELGEALHQAQVRHTKIGHYTLQAQKALAENKPFDYDRALEQISAVIGLRGPEEFLVSSRVEGTPAYDLTEEEHRDFLQGRGPAWEEEQRRRRERDEKRLLE